MPLEDEALKQAQKAIDLAFAGIEPRPVTSYVTCENCKCTVEGGRTIKTWPKDWRVWQRRTLCPVCSDRFITKVWGKYE